MAVPRGRVAGAHVDQVGLGIVGAAEPGRRAAGLPGVARPRGVGLAGDAVLLAVQVAHVAFDHRTGPDQFAGLGVTCVNTTDDAEFATRHAGNDQALHDQRSGGVRIAGRELVELLFPNDLAGVLVEGHQLRIQGAKDDQVVVQGGATVDHVTARHDAFRQTVVVLPEFLAGQGVNGVHAAVRGGDEDFAVMNQRLRLLAALLFTAELEGPCRNQLLDVGGVDLVQGRIPLPLGTHAERQHIAGRLGVVQDHFVGHGTGDCGQRRASKGGGDQHRKRLALHGFPPGVGGRRHLWRHREDTVSKRRAKLSNKATHLHIVQMNPALIAVNTGFAHRSRIPVQRRQATA